MKCPYPVVNKDSYGYIKVHPCGQCIACRVNKASEWASRVVNEMMYYDNNAVFLTLTYDDEHLPSDMSVSKVEIQKFMKRFRKRLGFGRLRYFGSGEYGDKSMRPHYHLIVFGVSPQDDVFLDKRYVPLAKGYQCRLADWSFGMCFIGDVTYESARYVAKYALKKVTGLGTKAHYERLSIQPEFQVQSTRPGIGARYVADNAERLRRHGYLVGPNGSKMPLPRYYKDKLFTNKLARSTRSSALAAENRNEFRQRAAAAGKSYNQLEREILENLENLAKSEMERKSERNGY